MTTDFARAREVYLLSPKRIMVIEDIDDFVHAISQKMPLTWHSDQDERSFAICAYSNKVAKIAVSSTTRLAVTDVMVVPDKWCERGRQCLDATCPLNRTTRQSLAREFGVRTSQVPENWSVISALLTQQFRSESHECDADVQKETRRKPIQPKQRFRILERDGFRCCYCGRDASTTVLHVDHIVPVAAGGSDDDDNLQTTCQDCNLGKSTKMVAVKR